MRRAIWALFALATTLCAQSDLILTNGKIITVDERFSIAQAVAIRGDRVVATGTDQEIARLAGPNTRRFDLKG
jgi:predicted amidohydrolase YtcJ